MIRRITFIFAFLFLFILPEPLFASDFRGLVGYLVFWSSIPIAVIVFIFSIAFAFNNKFQSERFFFQYFYSILIITVLIIFIPFLFLGDPVSIFFILVAEPILFGITLLPAIGQYEYWRRKYIDPWSGEIIVKVLDPTNLPISGANVKVHLKNLQDTKETNENGLINFTYQHKGFTFIHQKEEYFNVKYLDYQPKTLLINWLKKDKDSTVFYMEVTLEKEIKNI